MHRQAPSVLLLGLWLPCFLLSVTPTAALNWIGSMIAMLGTYLYSVAKQRAGEEAKAAKAAQKGA